MSRTELILVIAGLLFAAFALGWAAHWLVRRITRVDQSDLGELERMAQALNAAEELRDQAITYIEAREAELTRELRQTQAELAAAMDGLRNARAEAEQLRRALERRG
jgi:capsule polysaccharide export protein KpsE/RkpR